MSLHQRSACLTCHHLAPNIGAGGFLGYPDPKESDTSVAEVPTFGFLYAPLIAVSLRPLDLELFHDWLRLHAGHRVITLWDLDDLDTWTEAAPGERTELVDLLESEATPEIIDEKDKQKAHLIRDGVFTTGIYSLQCSTCGEAHAAVEPEPLRAFSSRPLGRPAVDLVLARWAGRSPENGFWQSHLPSCVDPYEPFMERLPAFFQEHSANSMMATLA